MPSKNSSPLDAEETTQQKSTFSSYGDALRRSCEAAYRSAHAVYSFLDADHHTEKAWDLENCRDVAWFTRHSETGNIRIVSKTCHLRWCPLCADSRRNYISFEVQKWVETLKHPKFLTLTLKHSDSPLQFQINKLYQSFISLRRRKHFKDLVTGGIWFFQVKKSKKDHKWHPHIHCLIGGEYIPHSWLSKTWSKITYGSTVVDIRPIKDLRKACNDAARYAACPGSLTGLSLQDGVEIVETMHGRRIVGTWGTARSVSLRPPKISESGKWQRIGRWDDVMLNRDTDQNARAIAYAYYNNQPIPEGIDCNKYDELRHDVVKIDIDDYDWDKMYPDDWIPP